LSESLQALISDLETRGVVCPLPIPWEKLCQLIRAAKKMQTHPKVNVPETRLKNPLILAGWGASDLDKWERFQYHLEEADKLGMLPFAKAFLEKLEPTEFLMTRGSYSDESVWDIDAKLRDDVDKVLAEALPFVKEALDLNVLPYLHYDPEKLYSLFKKHGFYGEYAPAVSDASDFKTIEALRGAHEIYKQQADMMEGHRELQDFCDAVLDLRIRLEA
jgi:hypothetical protein